MITIQRVLGLSKRILHWPSTLMMVAILTGCSFSGEFIGMQERWLVYYNDKAPSDQMAGYDVVVFNADAYPETNDLPDSTLKLAYLSVGEINKSSPLLATLNPNLLIQPHDHWDSYLVDIRQPEWYNTLLFTVIPEIKSKGFNGLMLDTLDSPLYLENKDNAQYKGMRDAAIYIVRAIHHHYPELKLMVNRGFDILPEVAGSIDMILAESTLSHTDLASGTSMLNTPEAYQHYLAKLNQIRALNPFIKVYSLDYWDMTDNKGVQYLYKTQRKHGFVPYVTTPDLTEIHHESKASFTAPSVEETSRYA